MKRKTKLSVKTLIENFDYLKTVKLYITDDMQEDDDPIFEGAAFDAPWWISNYYVDSTDNGEGIGIDDNTLIVYMREVDNDDSSVV